MSLKLLLFVVLYAAACGATLFAPIWGVLGYAGIYVTCPPAQWWYMPLRPLFLRVSFLLAALTGISIVLNWRKLRFGQTLLCRQEKLILLFLGIVWLCALIGPETVGRYTRPGIDHPALKLTKNLAFVLMLTHVVTTLRNLDRLFWTLIVCALILGLQAWDTPYRAFQQGRLEGVGGPDFMDANYFAAFMVGMIPIIGVQFLRVGWLGKLVCLVSGTFTLNAIVLTRSRGAVVGLAATTLAAASFAPRRYRWIIRAGLVAAILGGIYLANPQFIERSSSIVSSVEDRDESAQSRFRLVTAGLQMLGDHPFGVGPGNFYQTIGKYIPEYAGMDAHNAFVRCATELGVPGIAILVLLIFGGFRLTRQVMRETASGQLAHDAGLSLFALGVFLGLCGVLTCCLTMSLTYVEFFWWFLALPVCVRRALEVAEEDALWPSEGVCG